MVDAIVKFFENTLNNDILTIILISMIPMIELRGAIPIGVKLGMGVFETFGWAWIGSTLVAPFLLLLLIPILNLMKKWKPLRYLADAVEDVFRGKAGKVTENASELSRAMARRKKMLGVYLFVAAPIPMTGIWTGSAVAVFISLGFWKSLAMLALGNLTAGIIVAALTYFLADYVDYIIYALLGIVAVVLVVFIVKLAIHIRRQRAREKKDKNDGAALSENAENDADVDATKDSDKDKD